MAEAAAPWIFLRGLMRDARHWGDFPRIFSSHVSPIRVVSIDFPGNGARYSEQSLVSVLDMVEDCRGNALKKAGPPPYHVFALSLGAMVAAAWACRYPTELAGCVLVNTSLRPFSPPHWRLRPSAWSAALVMLVRPLTARQREKRILSLTSRHHAGDAGLEDRWTAWAAARPVSRANGLRQLVAAARFRGQRSPPSPPLLVLTSVGDGLVDYRCSLRLARQWGSVLRVHPSAGHDLPLDDGHWVAEQTARWLARTGPA